VLHIRRGEIRDTKGLEAEGDAEVVDAAAGEIGSSGGFPKRGVEVAAAGRKAEDAPARVLAVALDDGDSFRRAERGVEHGGIAEVQIDFAEDEFAEGNVIALRQGLEKGLRGSVMRRGFAVAVEQDVRVDGSHDGLRDASLVVEGKVV
jgi:hypothetical protein